MGSKRPNRPDAGDPRLAVAYVRVSTAEQQNGPEAQRAAIEAWARANEASVVAWLEDRGVSGATPVDERPNLLAALQALRDHGAGLLVIAKRDRLARDVVIAAVVDRLASAAGARVVSADGAGNGEGPESELMRSVLAAIAQYERALIRARTRAGLAAKRARGERLGAPPLGKRVGPGGELVPHVEEARALERMLELAGEGLSSRRIAATLDAEGHRPRGARWHHMTVQRILTSRGAGRRRLSTSAASAPEPAQRQNRRRVKSA